MQTTAERTHHVRVQVALNRGDTMRNGRDSEHGSYAPHNSSRTIHDSRHSIGVPASPNGHVSNNGEDDHTAVRALETRPSVSCLPSPDCV